MTRLLIARLVLVGIGLLVWVYGNGTSQPRLMYAGMGIIFVALLLRFAQRWVDRKPR
jgi:hypothetical protein